MKKELKCLFEVSYGGEEVRGWSLSVWGGMDGGRIVGNNYGGMVVMGKEGIMKWGNK